jgi:2-methylcitrate dehydratase PrpD
MPSLSQHLSEFATNLTYEAIPPHVRQQAVDAILDTVGVTVFGSTLPWSRIVIDYATRYGGGGTSTILGTTQHVNAPFAALANGALGHAFEMDNLRQPSAGVHAGSTLAPALFAIGEEVGANGRDLVTAFVAGQEVMSRIGDAAANTAEKLGFHSPGLTGVFGSVVVAGRLLKLDAHQMVQAMGIGGSMCSGLLAFSKAGNGGTIKRLHTGRASEGGVLAARLALDGFEGPDVILEGKFGFFEAFTRDPKLDRVLKDLGTKWETSKICVKCYSCHVTAHTPVQALEDLRAEHEFTADDVAEIRIATSEKVLSHHNILNPQDIATAQYSLPFCIGTALYRDVREPASFLGDPHKDANIIAMAHKVKLSLNPDSEPPGPAWATVLTVVLKDGRELTSERSDFRGAPTNPMSAEELDAKFLSLTKNVVSDAPELLRRLRALDALGDVRTLFS